MSIMAEIRTPQRSGNRMLLSVSDLAVLPRTLPSGDVRYELDDGELKTMAPPGDEHAFRQAAIIHVLFEAVRLGLGQARGEVAMILRRNPDRVVSPDAALILKSSLPVKRSREGYLETIPELVVEVRSQNDAKAEILAKNDEYFAAGVKIVWVVETASNAIFSHAADGSVTVFREGDTLTCPLLPGFAVAVTEIMSS